MRRRTIPGRRAGVVIPVYKNADSLPRLSTSSSSSRCEWTTTSRLFFVADGTPDESLRLL